MTHHETSRPRTIAWWLTALALLIAIMVTVGGATRLTDSGLSITEWGLVMGTVPPLTGAGWEAAFASYRQIPEYTQINYGMTLAQFQEIFWWEWAHRFLGRIIGLFVLLPLLWWSVRGVVTGALRRRLFGIFVLVCLQGVIGWFMVASGLSERTDVSQYRLALHLGTAFILFGLVVWQAIALFGPRGRAHAGPALSRFSVLLVPVLFAQIILGAFVAGLDAGMTYTDWPLMDGAFVPDAYFPGRPRVADLFESIAAVQFNHRIAAYLVFALIFGFAMAALRGERPARRRGMWLLTGVSLQVVIGIATLMLAVPLGLGLLHQLTALALFGFAIVVAYDLAHPQAATKLS